MPPKVRYDQAAVVEAAFQIARKTGMEGLNARAIARQLGCSTQPLYRELKNMAALRQAVMERASRYFDDYILSRSSAHSRPYLGSGLAFLRFAWEEAPLFRVLFMRERSRTEQADDLKSITFQFAAGQVARNLHYTPEQAQAFHEQNYIFVHGLAVMLATGYLSYDERALETLLHRQYRALCLSFEAPEND